MSFRLQLATVSAFMHTLTICRPTPAAPPQTSKQLNVACYRVLQTSTRGCCQIDWSWTLIRPILSGSARVSNSRRWSRCHCRWKGERLAVTADRYRHLDASTKRTGVKSHKCSHYICVSRKWKVSLLTRWVKRHMTFEVCFQQFIVRYSLTVMMVSLLQKLQQWFQPLYWSVSITSPVTSWCLCVIIFLCFQCRSVQFLLPF